MTTYTVKRNGEILMEEVRAHTPEDAIDQVQNAWTYENFGQGGALTERERFLEDEYMDADFEAVEEITA